MTVLDSNVIIYAVNPSNLELRRWIEAEAPAVSAISVVEVLGYHKLTVDEKLGFESLFAASVLLEISAEVVNHAVALRQARSMSLGDSLIAATAIVHRRDLTTVNLKDFSRIPNLVVQLPPVPFQIV